jgi:hypothetical protein
VGFIDEGKWIDGGNSGLGRHHFGASQDMKWVVTRQGAKINDKNTAHDVRFYPVDVTGNKWKINKEAGVYVGEGTWCDIHVHSPVGLKGPFSRDLSRGLPFKTRLNSGGAGMQLIIESMGATRYSAGLYDLQGRQRALMGNSGNSQIIIPLRGFPDGMYLLRLKTGQGDINRIVHIPR